MGDSEGLKKAFSERALKGMAISMVAQYLGGSALGVDGLGIDPTPGLENLSSTMVRIVTDAG